LQLLIHAVTSVTAGLLVSGVIWICVRVSDWCSTICGFIFFFNDTATTEIYTLSLHDALPISFCVLLQYLVERRRVVTQLGKLDQALRGQNCHCEHFHPEVAAHSDSEQLLGK